MAPAKASAKEVKPAFKLKQKVTVVKTGASGPIKMTNGHAFKVMIDSKGKWFMAEELRKARPEDSLEVGQKLHATYIDGEFYPATVLVVSQSKKRAAAPVKVRYTGYGESDDAWLDSESLKSKKLPNKNDVKIDDKKNMDYSGLEKGMRLQAEADGKWYAAEVVAVSKQKNKAKAPVKVHWTGYTNDSDEWMGAERLRSKVLKPKLKEG